VYCPATIADTAAPGESITLWTYQAVSDSSIDLYGFAARDDLELFEALLAVSGIGPKKALSIMTVAEASSLRAAIASEEAKQVSEVAGVGKKVADKIVLELAGKLEHDETAAPNNEQRSIDNETLEALTTLGYSASEAREAIKRVPADVVDTSERVRYALREMQ
jgi:Holliday junction DNA helicase RuvA